MTIPVDGSEPHPGRGILTWIQGHGASTEQVLTGRRASTGASSVLPVWFDGAVADARAALLEAAEVTTAGDAGAVATGDPGARMSLLQYVTSARSAAGAAEGSVLQVTAWQNRDQWSNCTGTTFDVPLRSSALAGGAATVDVLGYEGQLQSVPVCSGCKSVSVSGLPEDQTVVFVVRGAGAGGRGFRLGH